MIRKLPYWFPGILLNNDDGEIRVLEEPRMSCKGWLTEAEWNHGVVTIADIVSEEVLDRAYAWLCKQRKDWPQGADVWAFRRRWAQEKVRLRSELLEGTYRVSLLSRVTLKDKEDIDLWSARDAVVLKALTMVLAKRLPVSPRCVHVKGHGGAKAAVRQVKRHLPTSRFVLRTDVSSYYDSIDHFLLLERLAEYVKDRDILNLLWQYMSRSSERGGLFWDYERGISRGCPLSPLIGAFFLKQLDDRMERLGLSYVRFMDDILVLSPTRWRLRKAVKVVNQVLGFLRLEKHPEKTFIGRIERGFDFLGYHFSRKGLTVARETLKRFVERATRLYEQEPGEPPGSSRLGLYVKRWLRWVNGGINRSSGMEYVKRTLGR
jgi:RNA-directed DNA polymerase